MFGGLSFLKFWENRELLHYSDCAVYNEPAYPAGPCDCGAVKAHKRWWTYLYRLFCIRHARLQSVLRSRLRTVSGLPPSMSNGVPYENERCRLFDSNGASPFESCLNHKHEAQPCEGVQRK